MNKSVVFVVVRGVEGRDLTCVDLWGRERLEGGGLRYPTSRENERDAQNFLYAALERTACAPLFKERRR